MIALKIIGKILLLPVWLILAIIWLIVHIVVSICGIFHGIGKAFLILFAVLALAFGMYRNAMFFTAVIAFAFLIMLAGAAIELLLEDARKGVGRLITS